MSFRIHHMHSLHHDSPKSLRRSANTHTELNSEDVREVQKNWHDVTDISGLGIDIFVSMFDEHKDYADLFRGIIAWGEVGGANPKLRQHSLSVMSTFGAWISALHDRVVLDGLLYQQSIEHKDRGIGAKHFAAFRRALFHGLKKQLGPDFNRPAWDAVYNVLEEALNSASVDYLVTRLN